MASIKIILREDRINAQNQHPLWIRLIKNRKSSYSTLDIEITKDQWDDKNKKVRKSHPSYNQLNAFIAQRISELQNTSLQLESQYQHVSSTRIKQKFEGKAPEDFFTYADRMVDSFELKGKIGTYRRCKAVIHKLRAYLKGKPLYFEMITVSFLSGYQHYLMTALKNRQNTIHANIKFLRTVINSAVREDVIPMTLNPFPRFQLKTEKTQRAFLMEDELENLDALILKEGSMLHLHKNMYVFAAWSGGIRISDLLLLRWKNFDGEKIIFKIQKTQNQLSIKLAPRAIDIINTYKLLRTSNDFIFPVLKIANDETNLNTIHNAIGNATAYVNKDLKQLAKMAGIEKHISFHTSRNTWATRALTRRMKIEHVSKLMGHASIKETQIYARIINEELEKAMDVFNDNHKSPLRISA